MSSFFTKQFTSEKLTHTGDKSGFVVGVSGEGYLRQLDEKSSALNGIQYGIGFKMTVEIGVDVSIGDRLTVDGVKYEVKGIKDDEMGSIEIRELLLNKRVAK
jgi:hypothetical protein